LYISEFLKKKRAFFIPDLSENMNEYLTRPPYNQFQPLNQSNTKLFLLGFRKMFKENETAINHNL